jgi:hypothetical protein
VTLPAGTNPQYNITVTNTGNATLTTVVVSDPMFPSLAGSVGPLAPGQSTTITVTGTWASGTINNTASVTATDGTTNVADSDPAVYIGTFPLVPAVDIEKFIKDANGVWQVGRWVPGTRGQASSACTRAETRML